MQHLIRKYSQDVSDEEKNRLDNIFNEEHRKLASELQTLESNASSLFVNFSIYAEDNLSNPKESDLQSFRSKYIDCLNRLKLIFERIVSGFNISMNTIILEFNSVYNFLNTEDNLAIFTKQGFLDVGKDVIRVIESMFIGPFSIKKLIDIIDKSVDLSIYSRRQGTPTHSISIDGVEVVISNIDYDASFQEEKRDFTSDTIGQIRHAISKLQRAGFGPAIKDFKIVINYVGSGASGDYAPKNKIINLYPTGVPIYWTLCHEFAHKYYFNNMSSNARDAWRKYFQPGEVKREDAIHFISTMVVPAIDNAYLDWNDTYRSVLERHKLSIANKIDGYFAAEKNEINKKKYYLLTDILIKFASFADETNQNPDNLSFHNLFINFINSRAWKTYSLEEDLTEYARTMPEETFAEALTTYIWMGPARLPPKTRALLRNVVSAGGVNLKYASMTKDRIKAFKQIIKY